PGNVAPIVAWLATDDAAGINGQIFVVFGGTVQLIAPFAAVASLKKDARWSIKELIDNTATLFAGRSSGTPAFPVEF
ncbi:MAG TPA: hypothetical protein VMU77_03315, partial [Acidimicrobiales bacterium]|nr:hypothetical protein [Acidimicrobiales bacterium]